jgi:hypothetical protein
MVLFWRIVMSVRKIMAAALVATSFLAVGPALADAPLKPAGQVSIDETQFGFVIGGSVGGGELTVDGKKHAFQIGGLSLGANIGVSKFAARGEVYNLKNIEDFPGNYVTAGGQIALGGGMGGVTLKNEKGVIMRLQGTTEGVQFNVGASGVNVYFPK